MTLTELLTSTIERLDRTGVPYMVTGSLASTYHGEPRATRDLDVVIDPTPESLGALVHALAEAGFYVDRAAAFEALRSRTQFNAIGPDALKIDFIIRQDRPFSAEEFGRRQAANLLGTPGYVATVEDMIIVKLEWARASDSHRQLRDVAGMVEVAGRRIDQTYVERWTAILGLTELWREIQESEPGN